MLEKDKNIKSLMDVGFHGDEADMIISLLPDVVMHLFL
jgi:hypothetical protein